MLLCDGCDLEMHMSCAGLTTVPEGDWLCATCLDILAARRQGHLAAEDTTAGPARSLAAVLSAAPALSPSTATLAAAAQRRFRQEVTQRKRVALRRLEARQRAAGEVSQANMEYLTNEVTVANKAVAQREHDYFAARDAVMASHGLKAWRLKPTRSSYIQYVRSDGSTGTVHKHSIIGPNHCDLSWNR